MRRTVALLLIVSCAAAAAGCCSHRVAKASRQIRDRLEVYGAVGFGAPPGCPVPPSQLISRLAVTGEGVPTWARIAQRDNLARPVEGRVVDLSLIDEFGDAVPSSRARVVPDRTITDGQGTALVVFVASEIGVYRVRIEYKDRHSRAVSYSTTLIVRQNAAPPGSS
jgi:hypothetical protein